MVSGTPVPDTMISGSMGSDRASPREFDPAHILDMRPARMLHVRLPFAFRSSATRPQFPAKEARLFVTDQATRLVLPSHIEAVADAAAAAADFARTCGLTDDAAFGIDMAVREAITNAIVHGNKEDDAKQVELTLNCSQNAVEIQVKDQGEGFDAESVPDPRPGKYSEDFGSR
jgi:serine/threonine-protein kinase RsbW